MFGQTFSALASLRRLVGGIAAKITAPLLLLSYRREQKDQNAVNGQAQMHDFSHPCYDAELQGSKTETTHMFCLHD